MSIPAIDLQLSSVHIQFKERQLGHSWLAVLPRCIETYWKIYPAPKSFKTVYRMKGSYNKPVRRRENIFGSFSKLL
jgi:hypothetical protein